MTTATRIAPFARTAESPDADATWYAGHLFTYLLGAAESGDGPTVIEALCRPGLEPPEHVHAREDEIFYILEGSATFQIDGVSHHVGPGSLVWMPRGHRHGFAFHEVTRLLIIMTPGANTESLFREFAIPAERRELPPEGHGLPDFAAMGQRMAELEIPIVGPPVGAGASGPRA